MSSRLAFTMVEVVIVVALLALGASGAYYSYGKLKVSHDVALINDEVIKLNHHLGLFTSTGGTVLPTDDAPTVLLKLQTPLDDTSAKATNGVNGLIPANYDFQAYSTNDGLGRIQFNGTKFVLATSGAGYRPIRLATPKAITPVSRTIAGQQFGTTSKWVWQFTDANAQGANSPPTLSIAGPSSITSPGTYTWTVNCSVAGPLTLTLRNGQTFSTTGAALSQSANFNYGDQLTFTITGSYQPNDQTSASTVMLPVVVNIPISALSVLYTREDGSTSTNFTYAQVTSLSSTPSVRDGILLSVSGNPPGVSIYYTYDGTEPSTSSNLYSGAFHVPIAAWASSISLKAVAVSTTGQYRTGPVTTVTLTPTKVQLTMPSFSPSNASPILDGSSVTVVPGNTGSAATRTELGSVTPTIYSSSAATFVMH